MGNGETVCHSGLKSSGMAMKTSAWGMVTAWTVDTRKRALRKIRNMTA